MEPAVHGFIQTFGTPQGSGEGRPVPHDTKLPQHSTP